MSFLYHKRFGSRVYVCVGKSLRIDGKPRRVSIAHLGRLDGFGKLVPDQIYAVPSTFAVGDPVVFTLSVFGVYREFRGMVVQSFSDSLLLRYPYDGQICEVQIPLTRCLPLVAAPAGHGKNAAQIQPVLSNG